MAGEEYQQAVQGMEAALNEALKSFVEWAEVNWRGSGKEEWEKNFDEPYPEGHQEGWDACIDSLKGALSCFFDEYYFS